MQTTAVPPIHDREPAGAERSERRDALHAVLLLLPWALVAWLWWRVGRTTSLPDLLRVGGLVVGLVAVTVPVTVAWIAHNVAIFRRKGPRRSVSVPRLAYDRDWTGRPVEADWSRVRSARVVVVATSDAVKAFLPSDDRPGDSGHAGDVAGLVGDASDGEPLRAAGGVVA